MNTPEDSMKPQITVLHIPHFQAWSRGYESGCFDVGIIRRGRLDGATPSLLEQGVEIGTPVERIGRLYPHAHLFDHDQAFDRASFELFLHRLHQISPAIAFPYPRFYALEIPSLSTSQRLAERLNLQVGYASDTRTASFAALDGYRGVVNIVPENGEGGIPDLLSIDHLHSFGFSEEIIERLKLFGYLRIGPLMEMKRRHLSAQFGPEGRNVYDFLHSEGHTTLPLWTPPPRIEVGYRWEHQVREPYEWGPVLHHLAGEGAARLVHLRTTMIQILLEGTGQGRGWKRALLLKEGTADGDLIERRALSMLEEGNYPEFGEMILRLGGLFDREYVQGGLFDDPHSLRRTRRELLRRFPGGLLEYEEVDPGALLPEERWRLVPVVVSPAM